MSKAKFMLVLDTDHLSVLGDPTEQAIRLMTRLDASGREVVTSVVSVEENLKGWLARIHAATTPDQEIRAYLKFQNRVEFFAEWIVLSWDIDGSNLQRSFQKQGVRIGTQDLKIAAIAIAHDATLLTRNAKHFGKVPGLKFENWLDGAIQ